jgi:hypothetical protein
MELLMKAIRQFFRFREKAVMAGSYSDFAPFEEKRCSEEKREKKKEKRGLQVSWACPGL